MQQMIDEDGNLWTIGADGAPVFAGRAPAQAQQTPQAGPAPFTVGRPRPPEQKAPYRWQGNDGSLMEIGPDGQPRVVFQDQPKPSALTPTEIAANQKAEGEQRRANTIAALMGQVRGLYKRDVQGGWPNAISGRVPALFRPENEEFNAAANGILPLIRPLVAQTAKEGDSDKEMEVFMAYIPKASDNDRTIERKLNMLETLIGGMTSGTSPSQTVRQIDEGAIADPLGSDNTEGYVGSPYGPTLGPSGPVDGPPPSSGGGADALARDTLIGGIDSMGRKFANSATLGMADRVAAAGNALLPIDNLFGADNRSIWDGSSFGQAYDANMALQQRTNTADQRANPNYVLAGDVGGTLAGMMLTNRLLSGVGAGKVVDKTGGIAGDTIYGTARGAQEGGLPGAGIGALTTVGGGLFGRYALAPALTKAASTKAGKAAVQTVQRGGNALANAGRGMLGRQPLPFVPRIAPAALSGGESAAMARVPEDVGAQLAEAQRMGLPMALADTSPQLQQLSGSVVRKSPDAYAMARDTLGARALGQADRAQEQIARNFGPIANPNELSAQLLNKARTDSQPFYTAFRSQPARTSPELEAMLATPAGREALANARNIAANKGRDPNAMGFDLDEQGQVILRQDPSPETLDLVKRGFDDVVGGYKNPLTGRLELNGQGSAVESLRQNYVNELDRLYPDTYPQARAAYAGPAAEREALQTGRNMATAHPRDIAPRMQGMGEGQREQFKLGQRVAMSDAVDRVRYSGNPYQNIYGSPVAQQRAATVFGEGPANGMRAAYDAEQRMAQTAYDTLGGSPTAMRASADEAFESGLPGMAADALISYGTGAGGQGIAQKALTKAVDNIRLRGSKNRADQLAPILFNTDPATTMAIIKALGQKSAARDVYVKRSRKAAGLFGASVGSAGGAALQ